MNINISGKSVRFNSNALFPVKYKAETNRDIFKDLKKLESMQNLTAETLDEFDVDILYDIVYVLAWFGDRTIPERNEWLLSFENFNVFEILPKVMDLLSDSLAQTKKKKNPHKPKTQKQPYRK